MSALLHAAAFLPLAWALAVASVSAEAVRRAGRRLSPGARSPGVRSPGAPSPGVPESALRVLVVRPCAGPEPHLERTLGSLAGARLSAPVRCVFAVADAADGALPAATAAAERLRAAAIPAEVALTALTAPPGPNRKAAQLAAVVARESAPFDAVLVADSDVDLDGVDLDALLGPLSDGARPAPLDAVWAPPVEVAPARSLGDRASAAVLGGSLHAFPLLAGLDPRGLVGKLFAVRAGSLAGAGGFAALTAHLGEDMELSRRLLARRGTIGAAAVVAPSLASGRPLRDVIARYARWITVIRAQRPALLASYPALFFATPLIVVLAALAAPIAAAPALLAVAVAVSSRVAVAALAARLSGRRAPLRAAAADALLADLVLGAAFLRALSTRTVVWRTSRFRIDRRGLLREAGA
ncbi:uncharacterized protein SOCE26_008450 [Sorangium cellulosum]|uniref:Ceramide glucosyltransferase n=1 Tax=Sorangium cellulosum TaxID=56 RepID=A0A2L0EJH4_SORCE|nr:glycosyltransferase [Sorangium cellulosum]AUX39453.1 uncharacterized protein SOCE26_008450 [Sorangium cellulosum]